MIRGAAADPRLDELFVERVFADGEHQSGQVRITFVQVLEHLLGIKESRLLLLTDGDCRFLDTRKKSMMDALRIPCLFSLIDRSPHSEHSSFILRIRSEFYTLAGNRNFTSHF